MKYVLLIIIFGLIGCKGSDSLLTISKTNFNLKGPVEVVSEKTIFTICDSILNIKLDTTNITDIEYRNLYFDKNGKILKREDFNMDSTLVSTQEYSFLKSGRFKKLKIYKNGKLEEIVIPVSQTNSYLETETFDKKTGKLSMVYQIEYNQGLASKKTVRNLNINSTETTKYTRDKNGNEIEILHNVGENGIVDTLTIKYLQFDKNGNWIKRLVFFTEDSESCHIEIRKLNYNPLCI